MSEQRAGPSSERAGERLSRSPAVFLPAGAGAPARAGRIAFWHPAGPPGSPGSPGEPGEPACERITLTVAFRQEDGVRTRTVPADVLPVGAALGVLVRARHHPRAHPATACWGAAALHALHLAARGRLLPGLTEEELDTWRAGPLDAEDVAQLRAVAAAFPAEAHAVPLPGGGPLRLPEPEFLVRRFVDAVADVLPRTPAAVHAAGVPFAAREPRRMTGPGAREWAASAAVGVDAGVRLSLRLDLRAVDLFDAEDGTTGGGTGRGTEDGAEPEVRRAATVTVQVHSLTDPTLVADAAALWPQSEGRTREAPGSAAPEGDGGAPELSGERTRVDALLALHRAARVWPPLGRLLERPVPAVLPLDAGELDDLLGWAAQRLAASGVVVHWPRSLARELTAEAVLRPAPGSAADGFRFFSSEALFEFRWQLALGGEQLTEAEMDAVAEAHRPLVRLRGGWVPVDPALVRKARKRQLGLLGPADALSAALTGEAEVDGERVPAVPVGALARLRERLTGAMDRGTGRGTGPAGPGRGDSGQAAAVPAQPAGLRATLRDYQLRGLAWLDRMTSLGLGACLADDMGLGKTVTLIALHLRRAHPAPTLVVCPASLLGNWQREIERFAPGVPVRRFHGPGRTLDGVPGLTPVREPEVGGAGGAREGTEDERGRYGTTAPERRESPRQQSPPPDAQRPGSPGLAGLASEAAGPDPAAPLPGFVLTTYGTLRTSTAQLASVHWGLAVADEAHHAKNPRSATAQALRTLQASARVALTGTPVENNLSELWALLDWTTPGLLGPLATFRARYARAVEGAVEYAVASGAEDAGRSAGGEEADATARLARLVRPFLLRRRKSDPGVAPELPPRTVTDHLVPLSREQAGLYAAAVRETLDLIEASDGMARRGLVMRLLTALKQICNHPAQYLHRTAAGDAAAATRSGKLELLDELLGTILAEGASALVFTQYVEMARLIEAHLAARGVPAQLLHGGTPVAQREAMVERFQEGRVPVFLLSLKAGGTGLNLTRASHVVHYDRWWNPAVEDQATDRAHRIGQTRPVQVHRLIAEGTVEERVAQLLESKQALADAVLGGDAGEGDGEADGADIARALTELSDAALADLVRLQEAP